MSSANDNGKNSSSELRDSGGQYTTLKPSVSAVQPTKIATPDGQEGSEEVASAMAQPHAGDPHAYEKATEASPQNEGSKEGGNEDKGGFGDNLKSGLVISGIVVALLGAVVAFTRKLRDQSN
eukprot:Gb_10058 [translate_table: standard]